MSIEALILAGGSGTRFWPASRRSLPKQFVALESERTLLQETADRIAPLVPPEHVWVSTTEALAAEVRRQLPEVPERQILAEPAGRNTAPAIGWAVGRMPAERRGGVIVALPSDHRIEDAAGFRAALEVAAEHLRAADRVLTLGVRPRGPETGYGYLEVGEPLDGDGSVRRVVRFTEKPDAATAARFLAAGNYLWNAGIFVFRGEALLAALARHAPDLARGLAAIDAAPRRAAELYAALPAISIDHALAERLEDLGTVPLDCGWNDLGSWAAVAEVLAKDADGNAARGAALFVEARGNLAFADHGTVALLGVEGLVVVRAGEAVLVAPLERAQEVRRVVDRLSAAGRSDLL